MSDNPYREALKVLDRRGWGRGFLERPDNRRVCALGALGVAMTGEAHNGYDCENQPEGLRLMELAAEMYPDIHKEEMARYPGEVRCTDPTCTCTTGPSVAAYNDHISMDEPGIRALFEKAAVEWDERH